MAFAVRSVQRLLVSSNVNAAAGSVRHYKRHLKPLLFELYRRRQKYIEDIGPEKWLELNRRSNYIEWNRNAELYAFSKRLQEDFDLALLNEAFIHRSYIEEEKKKMENLEIDSKMENLSDNSRLQNVGSQVIEDHVWNYFSHFYPRFPREGIQQIQEYLTSDDVLCHVSQNIGTRDIILSADYPATELTHANTLRAIVGALVESKGIERARLFVRDIIITQFVGQDINDFLIVDDYFDTLKDILKRSNYPEPEPRSLCQTATNTILANYHVGIYCKKTLMGHGSGETVKIAIQMASLDVLKRLFHTTDSASPLRYDAVLSVVGKLNTNLPLSEWTAPAQEFSEN